MANSSSYRVLLETQIKPDQLQAQINVVAAKSQLLLSVKLNPADLALLNTELTKIKATGATISKVKLFGDDSGGIAKANIEYIDKASGTIATQWKNTSRQVAITQTTMQNLTKDANAYANALMTAEKFLEKSKNMAATPQVQAAVGTATSLRNAVLAGEDLNKIKELNNQLTIQKSALTANKSALDSWIGGMKNAIKQTIEYAISVGMIYGALRQLKEGIQFVADLNKEMVKIQVLQVDGAKTAEEIGGLALSFNSLARELGSTTQEVARGSVEWLFN